MPRVAVAVVLAVLLIPGAAVAGDGFSGIVNSLEREYGANQMKIPFMGLANALVKVARPAGVNGFKFAVFEDIDLHPEEEAGFLSVIRRGAGRKWTPMVQVRSNRYGERTAIFVRKSGGRMNMVLAAYEPGEATVIQVKLDPERFGDWIQEPRGTGELIRGVGEN